MYGRLKYEYVSRPYVKNASLEDVSIDNEYEF